MQLLLFIISLLLGVIVFLLYQIARSLGIGAPGAFDPRFPVYSKAEIEKERQAMLQARNAYLSAYEEWQTASESFLGDQAKLTSDTEGELRRVGRKWTRTQVECQTAEELFAFLVEGNSACANAKETIANVRKRYSVQFGFKRRMSDLQLIEEGEQDLEQDILDARAGCPTPQ